MTYRDAAIFVGREVRGWMQTAMGIFLAVLLFLGLCTLGELVLAAAHRMSAPILEPHRPVGTPLYDARETGPGRSMNVSDLFFYGAPLSSYQGPLTPGDPLSILPPSPRPHAQVSPTRPMWHVPKPRPATAPPATVAPLAPSAPVIHPAEQPAVKAPASLPASSPPASTQLKWYETAFGTLQSDWQAVRDRLPSLWQIAAILGLALAAALMRWGIEILAVASFTVREWAGAAWAALENRLENRRRNRERKSWKDLSEEDFQRAIERRTKRIDKLLRRSDILYGEADRLEVASWGPAFAVRLLRRRAGGYLETAERAREELERAEGLWAELDQTRRAAKDAEAAERVRTLLRLLSSKFESAATRAFGELRKIDTSFDWYAILPDGLPAEVRERIVKLLRVVVGTSSLSEAQAAYGRALHILNSHDAGWGGRAA